MEATTYVYGPDLEVTGAGDPSFNGIYAPGIGNPAVPGAQWVKGSGLDQRIITNNGDRWNIGGNNGYLGAIGSEWPWQVTYVTDGAEGPSPTVTRKLVTIQEALDALQFKVNVP